MKVFKKLLLPIAAIAALSGTIQTMEMPGNRYLDRALKIVNALWVGDQKISKISDAAFVSTSESEKTKYAYAQFIKKMSAAEIFKNHTVNPELEHKIKDALAKRAYVQKTYHPHVIKLIDLPYILKSPNQRYSQSNEELLRRIVGSLCINQCAQELNLDVVKAPIKKVITINNKYYVVCEKVTFNKKILFSLKQIKQVYKIAKRTGYYDIHYNNLVNTAEGIAYLLDTEPVSFLQHLSLRGLADILADLKKMHSYMEPAANAWIDQKIQKVQALKNRNYE